MIECEHGTPGGATGGCPPCQSPGPAAADLVIYRYTDARFRASCPLACGHWIDEGDRIALIGEDHDHAVWAHDDCAERAAG